MVRFRFSRGDLLRTRFAIAPLMELVGAVYALRDPARSPVHRPWVEWARPRVAALDVALLAVGPQAAFTELHQTVWWEDGNVCVYPTAKAAADVDLAGRGLLLVPAV